MNAQQLSLHTMTVYVNRSKKATDFSPRELAFSQNYEYVVTYKLFGLLIVKYIKPV